MDSLLRKVRSHSLHHPQAPPPHVLSSQQTEFTLITWGTYVPNAWSEHASILTQLLRVLWDFFQKLKITLCFHLLSVPCTS